MSRRPLAAAAAIVATLALSGCVSLFPKTQPATIYRLAPTFAASASQSVATRRITVLKAPIFFTRPSANDLIITTTGTEIASIKGARWATPVQLMFDEALTAAFDGNGSLNLVTRGAATPPDLSLRVEVIRFDANYADPGAAPTVMVSARVSYTALKDAAANYETVLNAQAVASDNRVGPIVDAYNAATSDLLGKIVAETGRRAALVKPN